MIKLDIGTMRIYMCDDMKLAKKLCKEMAWQTDDIYINDKPLNEYAIKQRIKRTFGSKYIPLTSKQIKLVMRLGPPLYSMDDDVY